MTLDDVDRDLGLVDLGEGVARARIVAERQRPLVGHVVVGFEPVLPQHDWVGRNAAHLLDEASEVPGDLRVGRPIVGDRRRYGLRLTELVDLNHPGRHRAAADCQTRPAASPPLSVSMPKKARRQFFAWTRAEPMRSSQAWPAR